MTTTLAPRLNAQIALVESAPGGEHRQDVERGLALRLRQQELLAELGVIALSDTDFEALLARAVEFAAEGLEADLCKVLEYQAEQNRLLVRAGVGWKPGIVGAATLGADLASPSGYALRTGKPVISNHLGAEERFRTPEVLAEHGVRRAMNVILKGEGAPYGVLEVDSRSEGEFSEQDIAFLQGAANILGMAIERRRYERELRAAMDRQKALLREIDHRVENSLQMVAGVLELQANGARDPELASALNEAVGRVGAVGRIHERLYRSDDIGSLELADYLAGVCADLDALLAHCRIVFTSTGGGRIGPDQAVPIALLLTELVINAAKHAYPTARDGLIEVRLATEPGLVRLTVSDRGVGLERGFAPAKSAGLGMRIVGALIRQTGARLAVRRLRPGSRFVIEFPLPPAS